MANTVLITGASSGFGARMAALFAARGWNVMATMRDPNAAAGLPAGENLSVVRLDVEDPDSIGAAIAAGIARFGRIDALVNNAGYGLMTIFEAASPAAIRAQFDVNVFGAMEVTRAILPHFRANRAGTIVNISSGVGVFGAPMASIYTASKFALEGFSEALWYELAALGIHVKIVEPGGAPGTGFLARSRAAGADATIPDDYLPFVAHLSDVYGGMASSADPDAVEKIAEATWEAVTDGSDRLRYQPTEDIRGIVAARRGSSEDEYQALVRGFFAMPAAG